MRSLRSRAARTHVLYADTKFIAGIADLQIQPTNTTCKYYPHLLPTFTGANYSARQFSSRIAIAIPRLDSANYGYIRNLLQLYQQYQNWYLQYTSTGTSIAEYAGPVPVPTSTYRYRYLETATAAQSELRIYP